MSGARNFAIVTASYWGFTITDGTLRTLVLLHFHALGFTPLTLAGLFLLYELAGIFANLGGGWLATRFGIPRMLAVGISLQMFGLVMLAGRDPGWGAGLSVTYVMLAQGIAGVAKDITKTASKTAIKAASANGEGRLFRWVAWFTGSKNAMKGLGFFLGGLLLQVIGFEATLFVMAGALAPILLGVLLALPPTLGKAKASRTFAELFAKSRAINLLATARLFLFGARDVWFAVGLPLYLHTQGWSFAAIAGFLALWTIFYGGVQILTPYVVKRSADGLSREVGGARLWGMILTTVPVGLAILMTLYPTARPDLVVMGGLCLFGVIFAINSSLHSYLILAYAGSKKAAEDVGFYYAANAAGRLGGMIASGVLTQLGGLTACLWEAGVMLLLASLATMPLPRRNATEPRAEPALG